MNLQVRIATHVQDKFALLIAIQLLFSHDIVFNQYEKHFSNNFFFW